MHSENENPFKCDPPSDQTMVTKDELMWMYERMVSADRGRGGRPTAITL